MMAVSVLEMFRYSTAERGFLHKLDPRPVSYTHLTLPTILLV